MVNRAFDCVPFFPDIDFYQPGIRLQLVSIELIISRIELEESFVFSPQDLFASDF